MSIKLLRSTYEQIRAHAESTYPEECCGLLIAEKKSGGGAEKKVVETVRMKNAFDGPKNNRYHIDPLELFKTDRAVSQDGRYIAGVYHSHPDYPATLSTFDLDHSFSWYSYIVVSVPKGKADEVKSWIPNENRTATNEETIEIVNE